MRPKSMILIVVALGCGLIASIGISQVMENSSGEPAVMPTEKIYVSVRDIPLGQVLNAQSVKLEEWPKDKVPKGAVRSLEKIEGRRTLSRLYPGEPLLHAKMIDANKFYGPSEKIPKGMRVMSVKVTAASSTSGLLNPGDKVDVLVYLRRGKGIRYTTTRTILKNITVFAVNSVTQREIDENGSVIHAKTVSLLVKPDQVEKLTLAGELGKIKLSMRNSEDDLKDDADGATIADLRVGSDGPDRDGPPIVADNNGSDGITDFLRGMTTEYADTADIDSKWVMHIHTPRTIKVYNWDDRNALPRELAQTEPATGASESFLDSDPDPQALEPVQGGGSTTAEIDSGDELSDIEDETDLPE